MKKHAICMQCHRDPAQINLLTGLFPAALFDIYIHVDRKSGIRPEIEPRENVFFVPEEKRVDVRWGRFSQVEATLALFEALDPAEYAYIHLISGVDFPIKPPREIFDLCESGGKEYIQSGLLPGDTTWAWGGLDRFMVRYPDWMIRRPNERLVRALRLGYREIVMRSGLYRLRRCPTERFYRGSSWFSVSGEMVAWMLDALRARPEYVRFFRHGACIDEVFFATLARMSPFAGRIESDPRRYIRWQGGGNGGPAFLDESDLPAMRASKGFFARKIDDVNLCERIREELLA